MDNAGFEIYHNFVRHVHCRNCDLLSFFELLIFTTTEQRNALVGKLKYSKCDVIFLSEVNKFS